MADVRPFTALRPLPQLAHRVAAPPYDVVSADQARAIMLAQPDSFLRVTRPDADPYLDPEPPEDDALRPVHHHDPDVEHAHGRAALADLVRRGVLVREAEPAFWVYQQQVGSRMQTGIVGLASVDDYERGVIRVHEHTRPDKEDDRTRHLDVLDAHDEPVFLFHQGSDEVEAVVKAATAREHDLAVTTPDHVWHTLWRVQGPDVERRLVEAFAGIGRLYVADGHHRSAAAVRLAAKRRGLPAGETGDVDGFLAVVFPAADLTVLPYHRIVTDLVTPDGGNLPPDELVARLGQGFDVSPASGPVQPDDRLTVGLRTPAGWFRLHLRAPVPLEGSIEGLAVSLLQDRVLAPVLGITDPRRDPRLDFVGGPEGLDALDEAVASGRAGAAFALAPTRLADLVTVSDRGEVMPPKSTWFFPKPASGLLVHPLH